MVRGDTVKVCWCEQSGVIEDRASLAHALRDSDIDYFRYNWRHGNDDPYANVYAEERLSWSQGRSLLYEQACRNAYDFYIFADDDVVFMDDTTMSLRRMKEFLSRFQPLTACLASPNWHDTVRRRIPRAFRSLVHPYLIADLEVQIFSDFIAKETFPCIFDGGWRTFWYPNIAVGLSAPSRQLQFNGVTIGNGRANPGGYYGGSEYEELFPIIYTATFNERTPGWVRALTKRYGVNDTVRVINAFLSVRSITGKKALSGRSEQAIRRYFEVARELARASS